MVRGRAGLVEADDEATTRARIAETVREHVPDPAERAWIEPALLALLGIDVEIGSDQLFAAWRTFFERLAATSPVVMVFEDLHYADQGLLDFIDHLMEWSRGVPITVVTLARPELLDRRPDWGAGKRSFTSIYLEPLPPAEMERLLAGLVPGLPAKAVASIVARADGVPLYAVETVRMLLAQGRLVLEGGVVPAGRRPRRRRGPGDADRAHRRAPRRAGPGRPRARGGRRGPRPELQPRRASRRCPASPSAELEPRLRALVRRELLVHDVDPRSPERGQYAFVQALIREVAYNTLVEARTARSATSPRRATSRTSGTDELAGGLAGHYLAAQRLAADPAEADALAAQARVALRGAAERASALGSYEQAHHVPRAGARDHHRSRRAGAGSTTAHRRGRAPGARRRQLVVRHAEAAVLERRRTGDREAIALAIAEHARTIRFGIARPGAARSRSSTRRGRSSRTWSTRRPASS